MGFWAEFFFFFLRLTIGRKSWSLLPPPPHTCPPLPISPACCPVSPAQLHPHTPLTPAVEPTTQPVISAISSFFHRRERALNVSCLFFLPGSPPLSPPPSIQLMNKSIQHLTNTPALMNSADEPPPLHTSVAPRPHPPAFFFLLFLLCSALFKLIPASPPVGGAPPPSKLVPP